MSKEVCSRCQRLKPIIARGLCNGCYTHWKRKNNPESAAASRKRYLEKRRNNQVPVEHQQEDLKERSRKLTREWNREARKKLGPEMLRDLSLHSTYGITQAEYREIEDRQNGLCAVCENPQNTCSPNGSRYLHVDHDHRTGVVRGLLYGRCNSALGYIEDSEWLHKAVRYLKKPKA